MPQESVGWVWVKERVLKPAKANAKCASPVVSNVSKICSRFKLWGMKTKRWSHKYWRCSCLRSFRFVFFLLLMIKYWLFFGVSLSMGEMRATSVKSRFYHKIFHVFNFIFFFPLLLHEKWNLDIMCRSKDDQFLKLVLFTVFIFTSLGQKEWERDVCWCGFSLFVSNRFVLCKFLQNIDDKN